MKTIWMESGKIHIYLVENFCLMERDNKDSDDAGTPIAIVLDPSSFAIVTLGALFVSKRYHHYHYHLPASPGELLH
jgi:hypothetical protein